MTKAPCEDGKPSFSMQASNFMMGSGFPNPWTILFYIQAQMKTKTSWETIKVQTTGGACGALIQKCCWMYGIDAMLWDIGVYCDGYQPCIQAEFKVPQPQAWMADHLLRVYCKTSSDYEVLSRPFWQEGKGRSDDIEGATMWKPWAESDPSKVASPSSIQGALERMIGGAMGYADEQALKQLEAVRERQKEIEEQRKKNEKGYDKKYKRDLEQDREKRRKSKQGVRKIRPRKSKLKSYRDKQRAKRKKKK